MSVVMNIVILAGRLTRDPQLATTSKGTPVARLGLAVPRIGSQTQGSDDPPPCFVEVTAWGHLAEVCQQHLRKGAPVLVQGSLTLDRWEGKDGDRRQQMRVVAQRVQFLSRARGGQAQTAEAPTRGHSGTRTAPASVTDRSRSPASRA